MADFGIRFFLCNILICAFTTLFLMAKRILENHLTSRVQYHLWFVLLGILFIPFLPLRPASFTQALAWLGVWKNTAPSGTGAISQHALPPDISGAANPLNDFAVSVSREIPSMIGHIFCVVWLAGMTAMVLFVITSISRLKAVKKSALPLQHREIRLLYNNCLEEMKIKRDIPIYGAAFLKSPVITGLCKPCIYLPLHLISDFHANAEGHKEIPAESFNAAGMRYILLHELQHYKHKDAIVNCLMNLTGILYWCNPFVWYALKEMRNDRETACDTSVLKLLEENEYKDYGNTLINFAGKISLTPFPFSAGISGTMKQMQKRIVNISSYQRPSVWKKIKSVGIFVLIAVIFWELAPALSACAAKQSYYTWDTTPEKTALIDLSTYFNGYEGSFVLYDLKSDAWNIYNMEQATLRTAPNSTYKIYDALFGLEESVITPEDSFMAWDGTDYPFEAWNENQDLLSAMQSSVNWYFEEIDQQIGSSAIQRYIRKIGYGNENVSAERSSYWLQGTLKISPIEQVELLTDLYNNDFGFVPENVTAVKNSIHLFSTENVSSESKHFYGKTGTGRVDGQDVNGWFVGYVEAADSTYFFAANIQAEGNATGSKAAEISFSVLSDMGIWKK